MTDLDNDRIIMLCIRLAPAGPPREALLRLDELVQRFLVARTELDVLFSRDPDASKSAAQNTREIYAAITKRDEALAELRAAVAP